ncbi:MAG: helix-turn-helix transcriptional regulator [Arcobacteraceae bacterium]|nr:helix-turn-helix transcriptional regulator [Arcobacteraceae bacterium]
MHEYKIYNNIKLKYLEVRHITRDECTCLKHMNYTLNFLIVVKGSIEVEIINKTYIAKENSILVLNPFETHKCSKVLNGSVEYFIISIDFNWFKSMQKDILDSIFFIPLNQKIIFDSSIYMSLKNICNLIVGDNSSYLKSHYMLNLYLINIIEHYCTEITIYKQKELVKLEKVFKYIQRNYKNEIIINTMAKELNIDNFYMINLFKKYFKLAPYKFIINYRLYRSKKLLLKRYDISYIATEIGFYDQSHFHKQFKNNFGLTPKQYQKNQM